MRYLRIALCATMLLLSPGVSAKAETVVPIDLDGATVNFVVPDGYCVLETSRPAEFAVFETMQKVFGPSNKLLLWFIRCDELELLRLGLSEDESFQDYGQYFSPTDENGRAAEIAHVQRATLIKAMSRELPKFDIDVAVAETNERAREAFNDPDATIGVQAFGVVGHDDNALYINAVAEVEAIGVRQKMIGSGALTLINSRLVNLSLYRVNDGAGRLKELDRDARELVGRLLAANPDSDN